MKKTARKMKWIVCTAEDPVCLITDFCVHLFSFNAKNYVCNNSEFVWKTMLCYRKKERSDQCKTGKIDEIWVNEGHLQCIKHHSESYISTRFLFNGKKEEEVGIKHICLPVCACAYMRDDVKFFFFSKMAEREIIRVLLWCERYL